MSIRLAAIVHRRPNIITLPARATQLRFWRAVSITREEMLVKLGLNIAADTSGCGATIIATHPCTRRVGHDGPHSWRGIATWGDGA